MGNPDDTHADGAADPQELADEAFLFTIARAPLRYEAVTDVEEAAIAAWSHGRASPQEKEVARTAIRSNLAAKELMLSLRLQQAAAAAPSIPRRVSRAILRQIDPPRAWHLGDRLGLPSIRNWQFAGLGAVAVAAIVLMVSVRHVDGPDAARFRVAALSDRSVLGDNTGWVTRGPPNENPTNPTAGEKANTLDFDEFDVSTSILRDLFDPGAKASDTRTTAALTQVVRLLHLSQTNGAPRLIFDRVVLEAVNTGIPSRQITLRVYDLTLPDNVVLARALPTTGTAKAIFITLVP